MSRLIVKNLPSYVTPEQLRKHFQQKGAPSCTLTDVKIAFKRDGSSRRFGFVGFKTDTEAEAARNWFDRTFIDSSNISVSLVDGISDKVSNGRLAKRPRLGPSPAEQQKSIKNGKTVKTSQAESDSEFQKFEKVMQPRSKRGPSWANETDEPQPVALPSNNARPKPKRNLPAPKEPPDQPASIAEQQGDMSDLEWMRQRMTTNIVTSEAKAFEQSDDEQSEDEETDEIKPPTDPIKDVILQTARLFVRNLTFSCSDLELLELFQPFGQVSQVHIPVDPSTKQSKGVAYIKFAQPTCAATAYEALDKKSFQGRLLHILGAVDQKGKFQVEEVDSAKKKSLKDERNAKRKSVASKEFNWSMLYMNSDAVVSSIADRMSISKAEILNPESESAAVKLALAETHVISETKSYLESQGVLLDAFSSSRRSDTTILVKNIPYGTSVETIREMFEVHGELSRVLVPPAGTIAVVEFVHADEASTAFKAVAYRRLGNSVVYLEKGPLGMFKDTEADGTTVASGVQPITISDQNSHILEDEPSSVAGGTTLFVKNLAFSTTSERLSQVFRSLPSFAFARVQMKHDPKRPDAKLSMGYGFVGFKDVDGVKKALKSMEGYVLDGHALHVKLAGRGVEDTNQDKETSNKSTTTKMIVKNVPFEATKKDIRELFGSHGHLKSVRVPKRLDHRSRGFAFLEFVSRREAENAYNALQHTHLLGRHLVLQWADEADKDLDALRQKAGVGFGGGAELPGKKRKLELGDGDAEGDDQE